MATELLTPNFAPENFYSSQLTSDITDTATDIFLDVVPANSEGTLIIDPDSASLREIVYYNSKTSTKVTCPVNGRGYDNTTATPHTQGTRVIIAPIADWFNSLKGGNVLEVGAVTPEKLLSGTGTTWAGQTYTPTWTTTGTANTLGNGTLTGWYIQTGKWVQGYVKVTIGSTTVGGNGSYLFNYPVAPHGDYTTASKMGDTVVYDASAVVSYIGPAIWISSTTMMAQALNTSGTYGTGAGVTSTGSVPMGFGVGDTVAIYYGYRGA